MTAASRPIDVAFSFLASDQPTAEALADAVRSHVRPFVYSEEQKELGGKDGAAEFTRIYGRDASLVVVLYRSGYGTTKWTRIEESAITSRGVERGWSEVLVISIDGTKPAWIPASRLWLGFDQLGVADTAEVVIARHRDTGSQPRPESAVERAIGAAGSTEKARSAEGIARSETGVLLALAGIDELWKYLGTQVAELRKRAPVLGARVSEPNHGVRYFDLTGERLSFGWHQQYANTLDDSYLLVRELSWPRTRSFNDDPKWMEVSVEMWLPTIHPDSQALVWQRKKGDKQLLSTIVLAERCLIRLVERHQARGA